MRDEADPERHGRCGCDAVDLTRICLPLAGAIVCSLVEERSSLRMGSGSPDGIVLGSIYGFLIETVRRSAWWNARTVIALSRWSRSRKARST